MGSNWGMIFKCSRTFASVRSTIPFVWVQDYGGEQSSGIGVDGHDVLLIEDAHGGASPHPHTPCSSAPCKKWFFPWTTLLICTFQEVISSVNFSRADRLHGRNHFAHCRMNSRNNYQKSIRKLLKTCKFGSWGSLGGVVEPAWKKVLKKDLYH